MFNIGDRVVTITGAPYLEGYTGRIINDKPPCGVSGDYEVLLDNGFTSIISDKYLKKLEYEIDIWGDDEMEEEINDDISFILTYTVNNKKVGFGKSLVINGVSVDVYGTLNNDHCSGISIILKNISESDKVLLAEQYISLSKNNDVKGIYLLTKVLEKHIPEIKLGYLNEGNL